MPHYICTGGCRGVGQESGACAAEECPKYGEPLDSCDCEDDEHYGRGEDGASAAAETESTEQEES